MDMSLYCPEVCLNRLSRGQCHFMKLFASVNNVFVHKCDHDASSMLHCMFNTWFISYLTRTLIEHDLFIYRSTHCTLKVELLYWSVQILPLNLSMIYDIRIMYSERQLREVEVECWSWLRLIWFRHNMLYR